MNLFQYRDDLLEFDSGDLSRAAQTVENWFGVPVRFGGLSLLAFGGLELNWSPQSHVLHALSKIFLDLRNRILCQSHTFSVDWTVTIEA